MKLAFAAVVLLTTASAVAGTVTIKAWAQCGGKSNCPASAGGKCDAPWAGTACADGATCTKDNEYYYHCQVPAATPAAPQAPTPPVPGVSALKTAQGDFEYTVPLKLSNKFYRAQRSGKLPKDFDIPWRGDSGLKHNYNGHDVTGGFYDAGDNTKFNLPMSWTGMVLGWSVLEFVDVYAKAGELNGMLDNIKWANDYFLRCIIDDKTVVAQVNNGMQDHQIWDRPEADTANAPAYVVTSTAPGSDVAGSMGASLAVGSLVWQKRDPAYSAKLLAGAKALYQFATTYIGYYSDAIPDAANFYKSDSLYDDLSILALWLHTATGEDQYLQDAIRFHETNWVKETNSGTKWFNFHWKSSTWGCLVLLLKLNPSNAVYKQRMQIFVDEWVNKKGTYVQFSPKGLGIGLDVDSRWGTLRHASNAVFLAKMYAKVINDDQLTKKVNCFGHSQLRYVLGSTGQSFVVGYNQHPPQQAHHRGASCPGHIGDYCGYDNAYNPDRPNPHVIFGGIVGGPDPTDTYSDKRSNYVQNEVACDYNAGYTGALAAMISSGGSAKQCAST